MSRARRTKQSDSASTVAVATATEVSDARDTALAAATPAVEQPSPVRRKRGPRPGTESAKRGGMAVREKYGHDFFARIGAKGGKSVSSRRGADFYSSIGHKGGSKTRDRLGAEHYERIGRMGGLRQRKHEREALEAQEQVSGPTQETPQS